MLRVSGMRMPIVFRFRRLKMRKSVSGTLCDGCGRRGARRGWAVGLAGLRLGPGPTTIKLNIYNHKFQAAHTRLRYSCTAGETWRIDVIADFYFYFDLCLLCFFFFKFSISFRFMCDSPKVVNDNSLAINVESRPASRLFNKAQHQPQTSPHPPDIISISIMLLRLIWFQALAGYQLRFATILFIVFILFYFLWTRQS